MSSSRLASQWQRSRLIGAAVEVIAERGFPETTVSSICARAQVSQRTFYEAFGDLRSCVLTVLDECRGRVDQLLEQAFGQEDWLAGVRVTLAMALALLEDEPLLARIWFIEALSAGSWALERRQQHIVSVTQRIVERWPSLISMQPSPLAAMGVMESVMGILHAHIVMGTGDDSIELLGPLMGLIVAVYLDGDAAEEELRRSESLARTMIAERRRRPREPGTVTIPSALRDPRAHRARACLLHLARHPGASNRQVADAVGIARAAQISRLLARLSAEGLLAKRAGAPGTPNAWSLTARGEGVVQALNDEQASRERTHEAHQPRACAGPLTM